MCGWLCGVPENNTQLDKGLLLLRLVVGFAFVFHGWGKISDMNGAVAMFTSMGSPVLIAYIAILTEFFGGVALILGVATRFAGWMLTIFMFVAIYLVHLSNGYSMANKGYEYQLLLLVCALFFAIVGPGKFSMHNNWCKKH